MARTMRRPIPAGQVSAEDALTFGVCLSILAVMIMGLFVNWVAAALLAFTILFYVFVYTMWLKRRTPQNIVIGGAAGALPPVIGWAAVTGDVGAFPLLLFAIIFFWTPPHFWALSLYRSDDYARAGVPMLPVVAGPLATRRQIWLYTLLVVALGVAPWPLGFAGAVYGVGAVLLGLGFLGFAWPVFRRGDEGAARRLFGFSIAWLFLLFALLPVDRLVGG
jgi:protoheme IX farnesyltransferase